MGDDPLIDAIADAVERTPDVLVLRVHLAQLLFDKCRYAESLMQCGAALLQEPDHPPALELLKRCTVAVTSQARWTEAKRTSGASVPPVPERARRDPNRTATRGRHSVDSPWVTGRAAADGKATGGSPSAGEATPNGFVAPRLRIGQAEGEVEASASRMGVVAALVDFADSGMSETPVGSPSFTSAPEADQLLLDNPFAFLLGVLFDQGIPAARAWRAPYDLRTRLGHLDPYRIADDPDAVRRAIGMPPILHRFVEQMSASVVSAALIVCHEYQGDVSAIWQGNPTAGDVQGRLSRFPGIGHRRAAMAVQILGRDCGVSIRDISGPDIAYDVPMRRVLLRTGLAHIDELDHMLAVARSVNPAKRTEIDLAAWKIGSTWCRAGIPYCESCPLTAVCPKHIIATAARPIADG